MGILNPHPAAIPALPPPPPPVAVTPAEPTEPVKTDAEIEAAGRRESLLRRSRGRFGTILTGFRGFLDSSESSKSSGRKTLLGE